MVPAGHSEFAFTGMLNGIASDIQPRKPNFNVALAKKQQEHPDR